VSTAVRRLEVRVTGDARDLSRTFAQVNRTVGQSDGHFRKASSGLSVLTRGAGIAVAALGGAGLVGQAFKATQAAGNLGEQVSKSGAVFGKAAPEIQRWGKTTATAIGLSNRAALEAAGTFGNMLVPMGLARAKAADMSRGMVNLAGDLASFNNADPTEVLDSLRAGLAGETEPLRRFGVFLNAARVEAEALALGLAKEGQEVSAAAKAQATYSLILKDTKDAQGDFTRTSGSLANQQRILNAEWENAQAELGQALLPAMTSLVGVTRDVIGVTLEHKGTLVEVAKWAGIAGAAVGTYVGVTKSAAATSATLTSIRAAATGAGLAADGARLSFRAFAQGGLQALGKGGMVGLALAGVVGLTLAVWKLRDGENAATAAAREAAAANRSAADASRDRTAAVRDQEAALDSLKGANLGVQEASLRVEEATKRATEAEREHGRGSLEARRAALDLKRAQIDLRDARRAQTVEVEKQDNAAGRTAKALRDEVTAAKEAVRTNEQRVTGVRMGLIAGREADKITKEYAASQRRLNDALSTAAARHRLNAQRAREQAGAIKGTGPAADTAREKLLKLADVELKRAQTRELEAGLAALVTSADKALSAILRLSSAKPGAPAADFSDFRAGGGYIRGPRGAARQITAHGDEVVLNPAQIGMVGRDRIDSALMATGGVMGGRSFAAGGYVNPVPGGSWRYGPGAGTHSRSERGYVWQDDDAWDIMGSDGTPVYAGFSGTVGRVSGFNSDPRFWGHGLYLQGGAGTLFYKHLKSVAVGAGSSVEAGQLLGTLGSGVNGGPHLHLGAQPASLLSALRAGGPPGAGADGGEEGRSTKEELSPLARVTRALVGTTAFGGKGARALAGALTTGRTLGSVLGKRGASIEATSDRTGGVGLGAGEQRGVTLRGVAARRKARKAGKSPEEVSAAGQEAERKAEVTALKRHVRNIDTARRDLKAEQGRLNRKLAKILKQKDAKPGTKQAAARAIRAQLRSIRRELDELVGMRAEVTARLAELDEAAEGEAYDAAWEAGESGDAEPPPSAMDWADARMAQAGLTPGLEDDLAAAQHIEALSAADYADAVRSNDPRRIRDAANAWAQAAETRRQIEATMANTTALEANTSALRESFGGSAVFDYRSQRYAALPSSDRLETLGLGV